METSENAPKPKNLDVHCMCEVDHAIASKAQKAAAKAMAAGMLGNRWAIKVFRENGRIRVKFESEDEDK